MLRIIEDDPAENGREMHEKTTMEKAQGIVKKGSDSDAAYGTKLDGKTDEHRERKDRSRL